MTLDSKWVPMKWPCGPLEWARRSKSQGAGVELKNTLDAWAQPAALDLLRGTPINCLVVEWAGGVPEDSAQQAALRPLVDAGRQRGISFVGKVAAGADPAAVASARSAGLSAVMVDRAASQASELPVIVQTPRDKVAWEAAAEIFSSTDNEWPGPKLETTHEDTAVAGPTGIPWLNSNAWFSLLARELSPGKTLWLDFDPPVNSNVAHPANYALAVADSEAYGARWIISLDDDLRAGLLKNNPQALKTWRRMGEIVTFFQRHSDWRNFQPQGALAVVSDFRGDNAFMGDEVLNLLNRHEVQFQVVERSKALSSSTAGLEAILWLDKDAPNAGQLARLLAFARQGGLLIAPAYWGPSGVTPTMRDPSLDYKVYNIGQGQIAVPSEGFLDPYQVANDAHLLASRRHDLVRLYNPQMTNCYVSMDAARKTQLVQILDFSGGQTNYVTVWLSSHGRNARLWSPETKEARTIPGVPANPGTDFSLPAISACCALEVEGLPAAR
jgi:hypothetical protein